MTTTVTIDTIEYTVPILDMDVSVDSLYKYAERTADGVLHKEIIGNYHNYKLIFGKNSTCMVDFLALYTVLIGTTEFHTVIVPDVDGDHTFVCYFSNIKYKFFRIKDTNHYVKGLSVNFIARDPT